MGCDCCVVLVVVVMVVVCQVDGGRDQGYMFAVSLLAACLKQKSVSRAGVPD